MHYNFFFGYGTNETDLNNYTKIYRIKDYLKAENTYISVYYTRVSQKLQDYFFKLVCLCQNMLLFILDLKILKQLLDF